MLYDDLVDIVHCQLSYAALQGYTVYLRHTIAQILQTVQYATDVVEALGLARFVVMCGDGALVLIIVIGLGVSSTHLFCPNQQLWRELFVLMPYTWRKT